MVLLANQILILRAPVNQISTSKYQYKISSKKFVKEKFPETFLEPKDFYFENFSMRKSKRLLKVQVLTVNISFHNNIAISVDLPNQVTCKIEKTDATLKGQTVSSSYKPAILDNGLSIQVPPFIEAGDNVIIDTRNLEYLKKA